MTTEARSQAVEIPGYGPVEIRGLSKGRIKQMRRQADGNLDVFLAHAICRGVTDERLRAMTPDEVAAEFRDRPEALQAIGFAVLERSWAPGES